jgi:flagellar biosynthesis protein FliQ
MTPEYVLDLAQRTFLLGMSVAMPILGVGVVVGVAVAIFQAATQIQEASLNFLPKLVGMGVAMLIFGPWIVEKLTGFTITMITSISGIGG